MMKRPGIRNSILEVRPVRLDFQPFHSTVKSQFIQASDLSWCNTDAALFLGATAAGDQGTCRCKKGTRKGSQNCQVQARVPWHCPFRIAEDQLMAWSPNRKLTHYRDRVGIRISI